MLKNQAKKNSVFDTTAKTGNEIAKKLKFFSAKVKIKFQLNRSDSATSRDGDTSVQISLVTTTRSKVT